MQRWATTMSGLNGAYSSTSTSPTTNLTFASPAAAARFFASSICRASRSIPTTARQRGASASASRPAPVPTSSTVSSLSGSSRRSSRKVGLSPSEVSPGDCAIRRRGDEARVLRHHAPRVAWLRRLHRAQPLLDLGRGQLDVQPPLLDVEHDRVAVPHGGDRPADRGLRRDVRDHDAVRGAREAPVGHERDARPEAGSLQGARHGQHLPHPRPSLDRKSTRLNSSHGYISYAVFCLKKKKQHNTLRRPTTTTQLT